MGSSIMETRNLDLRRMRAHYETMLRIRAFEEAAELGQRAGEVRGAVHLSIGQEAVASGVCINLRPTDYVVSTHRGHGDAIAKGANVTRTLAELFGRADGLCHGKGGSMHLADFSIGLLGSNGVVAAGIPIAVGAAHASQLQKTGRVTVCFFGDGAVNRGPFLEGLNWARVFNLPILFVCEDNGFSATTRTANMTGGAGAAARAEAIGVSAVSVDGNDVSAVDDAAAQQLERIRQGDGPQFLHAKTYHLRGHTAHDPATYRSSEEVARQLRRDPLLLCRESILLNGVGEHELQIVERHVQEELKAVLASVRGQADPDVSAAWTDVQTVGAPVCPA